MKLAELPNQVPGNWNGGLRLGLSNSGDYFVAMMLKELHNEGFNNVVVNSNPSSVTFDQS